jgi:hypothetical protein
MGLLIAMAALAAPRVSAADMVAPQGLPSGSIVVFSQSGFIANTLPLKVEFDVPFGGTLSVELIDLGLPQPFESLTLLLTTGSTILADIRGPGLFSFELGSPSHLFGFLSGDPQGALNVGAYLVQVGVTPVPLPAAAWLLLSALGGLGLMFRRRGRAGA